MQNDVKTDQVLCEEYFLALGLLKIHEEANGKYLKFNGSLIGKIFAKSRTTIPATHYKFLPNILESFSAFKEHVLEVMGEEGWAFGVHSIWQANWTFEKPLGKRKEVSWTAQVPSPEYDKGRSRKSISEEIIDNHIPRAAVLAATAYWKGKK